MRYVILDNIRSAHNVGSIFRTCDGAGVDKIFLCGYTATPTDRFGRPVAEIVKTSLGACDFVPWEHWADIHSLIQSLKSDAMTVIAVEQTPQSFSLYDVELPSRCAFVFGNEVTGVQSAVCEAADMVIDIPMHGQKESLNVGVSVGVVLFHQCKQ